MNQIADQTVDRRNCAGPGVRNVAERGSLSDTALFTDNASDSLEFVRHSFVLLDHIVEGVSDLAGDSGPVLRQAR